MKKHCNLKVKFLHKKSNPNMCPSINKVMNKEASYHATKEGKKKTIKQATE